MLTNVKHMCKLLNIGRRDETMKKTEFTEFKAVRLPRTIVERVNRFTRADGSTFSQFMRTAVIHELNSRSAKKDAAA